MPWATSFSPYARTQRRANCDASLPDVLPDPAIRSRVCKFCRTRKCNREKRKSEREREREKKRPFSIHLPARTIVGKIITVFTGENTLSKHNRLSYFSIYSTRDFFHVRLLRTFISPTSTFLPIDKDFSSKFFFTNRLAIFIQRLTNLKFCKKGIRYLLD